MTRSSLTLTLALVTLAACGGSTLGSPSSQDSGTHTPSQPMGVDASDLCGPGLGCGSSDAEEEDDAGGVGFDGGVIIFPGNDAGGGNDGATSPLEAGLPGQDATVAADAAGLDSGPPDAGGFDSALPDASAVDSALPDASASPTESFSLVVGSGDAQPLSCPTSHWEFKISSGSVKLKNTGGVPLAYLSDSSWIEGVQYTPGVPTSQAGELVGVLAPGSEITIPITQTSGQYVALVGSSKPFSTYDGGFAAADEWTIPWPQGVSGSGGATTMYVAEIETDTTCSPVVRP